MNKRLEHKEDNREQREQDPQKTATGLGSESTMVSSLSLSLQLHGTGKHQCPDWDVPLLSCTVLLCLAEEVAAEETGPLKDHVPLYTEG